MGKYIYITPEQARSTHEKTIQYSGGGTLEELDLENWKVFFIIFKMMNGIQHLWI